MKIENVALAAEYLHLEGAYLRGSRRIDAQMRPSDGSAKQKSGTFSLIIPILASLFCHPILKHKHRILPNGRQIPFSVIHPALIHPGLSSGVNALGHRPDPLGLPAYGPQIIHLSLQRHAPESIALRGSAHRGIRQRKDNASMHGSGYIHKLRLHRQLCLRIPLL